MKTTPWGKWEVLLEEPNYKVKRITVNPGQRLSYQKHDRRQEHWIVVQGQAVVTLDGVEKQLSESQSVDIPKGTPHRISNRSDLPVVFVEVQMGEYFGENDIVRLEDDYGREGTTL